MAQQSGLAQREAVLTRLRADVRGLFPGYFALVMATGTVSTAVGADGVTSLSAAMLVVAIICYLALIGCMAGGSPATGRSS